MSTATTFRFPAIREHQCANGMRVLAVRDDEQDALTMVVQFPRGKLLDPLGVEGASELAFALLQKGPSGYRTEEFAEATERAGCTVFAECGEEHALVGCRLLSRFAKDIVPLFWKMVSDPAMDASELSRLKRELATALDAERADPSALAGRHFSTMLYGSAHRAGRHPSRASLKHIDMKAVLDAVRRVVHPRDAVLAVGGHGADRLVETEWLPLFEAWQPEHKPADSGTSPPPEPAPGATVRIVDKRDISQVSLAIGHRMPGDEFDDRHAIGLANYILGGGNFSSRLTARVRAELGRTYGISSQVFRLQRFGHISIGTATNDQRAGEMVSLVRSVYEEFCREGVTDAEVSAAGGFATGSLAFQMEGIGHIVEKLLWLRLTGRELSYIEQYPEAIAAVSSADVNQAIREYFTPEKLVVAAVGSRAVVEGQLQGIGPVEHVHHRAVVG